MNQLVHLPGFKEGFSPNEIWEKIRNASERQNQKFSRVILPWDPLYNWLETFSLASSKAMFLERFLDIREETSISVYSLSSWPAIQALQEALQSNSELADLIRSVIFLNPAKDPLHAVRVMDWIMRLWKWEISSEEYFLEWDYEEVFKTLIDWWKWNWLQFQTDLGLKRNEVHFNKIVGDLRKDFGLKILELANPDDTVTNWKLPNWIWPRNTLKIMQQHRIKESGSDIMKLLIKR